MKDIESINPQLQELAKEVAAAAKQTPNTTSPEELKRYAANFERLSKDFTNALKFSIEFLR